MAKGNSIRDEIREENKKMKDMNFFGKCAHIWRYYKFPIISTILVVALIVGTIIMIRNNDYERSFYCVIVDGEMEGSYDKTDYLTTNFTKYLGIDGKTQRVIFDNSYTFNIKGISDTALYDVDKIFTMAGGQTLDGYISEYKYALLFSSDVELFLEDLREWFTPEELEKLDEYLIYYTDKDGVSYPISIDISSTKFITEAKVKMTRPCFGIVTSSLHKENGVAFIRFLFDL